MPAVPYVGAQFAAAHCDAWIRAVPKSAFKPEFPVVHNTAAPLLRQWHECPGVQRMRNLADYYGSLGWNHGPHFFVADDVIWAFTPITQPGVHSPSWNHMSIGIEMVGDYSTEDATTGAGAHVWRNTVTLLASLCRRFDWQSTTLRLHKEDPLTTHHDCPGKSVVKARLMADVHHELMR